MVDLTVMPVTVELTKHKMQTKYYNTISFVLNSVFRTKKDNFLNTDIKGQMNQKFHIFYFSSILVKCVKYEPNKHTMKFQLNWSKYLRDICN